MNTIQSEFESYKKDVIPVNAGDNQKKETEKAFYAGALSCFQLVIKFSEGSEETGAKMLDTLQEEILEYFK